MKTNKASIILFNNIIKKQLFRYSLQKNIQYKNVFFQLKNIQFNIKDQEYLINKNKFNFCLKNKQQKQVEQQQQKKAPLQANQIPAQNLLVTLTQDKIQNQQVQVTHAKGTLSILDKVQGVKHHQSGDLYVLMFRCGQCNHQQIRSFTKTAYHKGVVLVRCGGCQKIHLVADNLGWFEDQPVNVETLHKDQVKKVHDPAAISMFLQKAFGQEDTLLSKKVDQKQNKQSKP